jgi:hypothetical protein
MYCQMFSTGFNSGARDGSKIGVMFLRVPGDRDHQFQAIVITDSRGA